MGSKVCVGFSIFADFMDSYSSCMCRLTWRGCPSGIKNEEPFEVLKKLTG